MDKAELIRLARAAAIGAYAPYSGFSVGAAVLTESGDVFTGANVENASYGLSVCAERIAIFNAVNAGQRTIKAIAVAADGDEALSPCGACLQVLAEFAADAAVYVSSSAGDGETTVGNLLSAPFKMRKAGR